jgi:hypothetical protein
MRQGLQRSAPANDGLDLERQREILLTAVGYLDYAHVIGMVVHCNIDDAIAR